ncbi:hypothetical protein QJS10_CPB17g00619 [Acorus calamus]|uniref:CREG-like beta-barrel domain-containing protein n=1 Tax=Acorus calamus TaxID=4465 RepID=A0AAV9CTJ8_ACOCL|nr:hypothetical protein QJS10_CPB17g00619 [Acorus calamus]
MDSLLHRGEVQSSLHVSFYDQREMESMGNLNPLKLSIFILISFEALVLSNGRILLSKKPDPSDAAATARWLASQNSWGVLSSRRLTDESAGLPANPTINVVSFSDGIPDQGRGIPFFYLTTLDPTARNALEDERCSFAISEFPLGTCGRIDPENPTCAKLTLTGKTIMGVPDAMRQMMSNRVGELKLVDSKSAEAKFAEQALFSKHAEMKDNQNPTKIKEEGERVVLNQSQYKGKPLSPYGV